MQIDNFVDDFADQNLPICDHLTVRFFKDFINIASFINVSSIMKVVLLSKFQDSDRFNFKKMLQYSALEDLTDVLDLVRFNETMVKSAGFTASETILVRYHCH